jgi:hypothetical protein
VQEPHPATVARAARGFLYICSAGLNGRSSLLAKRVGVSAASSEARELPGLRITDVRYPRFTPPWHDHEHACVTIALGGHRLARELRATDDAAPLALHGAALELLAVLSRTRARVRRRPPRWLDDVTDYLHEHKLERSHFTRTFVSYFGVPPGRWRSARA